METSPNRAAYTLMELAIASGILALVLASTIAIAGRSLRYISDMRRSAQASQILQQKMEDLRLLSWTQLQNLPSTFTDPGDTQGIFQGTITSAPHTTYKGATTVMTVTVSVTWTNRSRVAVSTTLSSLFSNTGLNRYIL